MESFEDLEAWKVAMDLLEEIYILTRKFPREEQYGLTSQLRRAAASIIGNIAEGFCRFTFADKANKYTIARGECGELRAYLLAAKRLKISTDQDIARSFDLANSTGRLLSGLIRSTNMIKHK